MGSSPCPVVLHLWSHTEWGARETGRCIFSFQGEANHRCLFINYIRKFSSRNVYRGNHLIKLKLFSDVGELPTSLLFPLIWACAPIHQWSLKWFPMLIDERRRWQECESVNPHRKLSTTVYAQTKSSGAPSVFAGSWTSGPSVWKSLSSLTNLCDPVRVGLISILLVPEAWRIVLPECTRETCALKKAQGMGWRIIGEFHATSCAIIT